MRFLTLQWHPPYNLFKLRSDFISIGNIISISIHHLIFIFVLWYNNSVAFNIGRYCRFKLITTMISAWLLFCIWINSKSLIIKNMIFSQKTSFLLITIASFRSKIALKENDPCISHANLIIPKSKWVPIDFYFITDTMEFVSALFVRLLCYLLHPNNFFFLVNLINNPSFFHLLGDWFFCG